MKRSLPFFKSTAIFFCLGMLFLLPQAEGRKKIHPRWNTDKCTQVLIKELRSTNTELKDDVDYYVIGKFVESDGVILKIENSQYVFFKIKSSQARNKALMLNASNIVVYGNVDISSGQVIFNVFYVEEAPSNREIFLKQYQKFLSKDKTTFEEWMALGRWALEKGVSDKDALLIKGSQDCFRKGLIKKEDDLDTESAQDVDKFLHLVNIYQELNKTYTNLNRKDLLFPRDKILRLVQVILKFRPREESVKKILAELGFVMYRGKYRTLEELKKLEGFVQYTGSIKEYQNQWVRPLMANLLNAVEDRIVLFSTLRQRPSVYQDALKGKRFVRGMDKKEIISLTGFPKEILRIGLKKEDKRSNIAIPATYELWKFGDRKDQYVCFEDGNLFYFPDTFAPLRQD